MENSRSTSGYPMGRHGKMLAGNADPDASDLDADHDAY